MEKKMVFITILLFVISQFIIFGSLFFSGVLRFEVSTPEKSKIFDVKTVIHNQSQLNKDSIASKNYYSYEMLQQKEKQLKYKQDSINAQVDRLIELKNEIEKRKIEVEKYKKDIESYVLESRALIKKKKDAKDKEYKKLSKIYANMDPAQAANYLSQLDNVTAIEILKKMNPEQSGPIMQNLKSTRKGVAITKAALNKYK